MTAIELPTSLTLLCGTVRPELACLGDLGAPLVAMLGLVERTGADRGTDALADPTFALDVLTAAGPGTDPAVVGRVLDFLRTRHASGRPPSTNGGLRVAVSTPAVTLADAVASYEASVLALMAKGTGHTYRTWTRRLVDAHGQDSPRGLTAGDLKDLIARYVVAARRGDERRRSGRAAEENAVGAFRSLWGYLVEKGWADENVALRLAKPSRAEPNRRPVQPDEAVLLRHLAKATGRDPLLDEVTLAIPERLGLRRIELCRLRLCDLDLERNEMEVWGKNDKPRTMPIPPGLAGLLAVYVEDRRPQHLSRPEWLASKETLLRSRPSPAYPLGRAAGRRRIEDLFDRLKAGAPHLFAKGDVSLHSYRHALGTFVDAHFTRAVTRAVLGHTSRRSPTDFYVHVSMEQKAVALCAYENHVVSADFTTRTTNPAGDKTEEAVA
ncbi:MAG: tyrosine-type recombinase/integrase [Acidimicrobiales bacterium]